MTESLLVTSTAEGTGKTAVAIALGTIAQDRGMAVGYFKPKGTKPRTHVGKVLDPDPLLAQELLDLEDAIETIEPVVYSSTFLHDVIRGRESVATIQESVNQAYESLAAGRDLVVIDGSTGIPPGRAIGVTDIDIAKRIDARVVLVETYEDVYGVDAIIAMSEAFGGRFAGVLFNAVSEDNRDEIESDIIPFLESRDIPVIGVLPRERVLATVTVGSLANEIGADVLTDCPTDARVSRFAVGAMSSDAALKHFRRTQDAVVITGGDRPGIQAAALEAPGIRALVLTGGYRPPSQIVAKAEDRGIPVLTVPGDTLRIIERIEQVLGTDRVRDPSEITVVRSLIDTHVDTDALIGTQ